MQTSAQPPTYRVAVFRGEKTNAHEIWTKSTKPTEAETLELLQGLDKKARKEIDAQKK